MNDTTLHELHDDLDVLVIGAGLSGMGAGRYLRTEHPDKRFVILEARAASGGTWDLFRYPGIRSDSDLNTFGYEFKPWRDQDAIADGDKILAYVRETATENGLDPLIRYRRRVLRASWSSEIGRWAVAVERTDESGVTSETYHAKWLFCATGYYRYDERYTPDFPGRERFAGQIVHPQDWPEDLDYHGKKVIVIGSGATAVTLLPAMATGPGAVDHITMLQRTPSYVMPVPRQDKISLLLRKIFGDERGYALTRRKNIAMQHRVWSFCQKYPNAARKVIRAINKRALPDGYDVDKHFNPPYGPWDQRLCAVPDGDLFKVIRDGKASVVTDTIDTFTERGILLTSGQELEADIIITATGLNLQLLGGIHVEVDGAPVSFPDTVAYRGLMLSGVPNMAFVVGYTNSSWTLKVGLLCEYFCQLLSHMDRHGYDVAVPIADPDMPTRPLLDFGAGYVQRTINQFPRQGTAAPWLMSMRYHDDAKLLRGSDVADEHLAFSRIDEKVTTHEPVQIANQSNPRRPSGRHWRWQRDRAGVRT